MITIKALFFAHYQDIVGEHEQAISVPEGSTVADMALALEARYAGLGDLMTQGRVAVNAEFATGGTALHDGDEVAWMPPMSGGCDGQRGV